MFLRLSLAAVLAALRAGPSASGRGADLSQPADHAHHPVPARRQSPSIVGRTVADKISEIARPADRHRQPRRRRRHRRHPRGREVRARRLHASLLGYTGTLAIGPTLYPERRLRPAQGFRADRPDRPRAEHAGGASVDPRRSRCRSWSPTPRPIPARSTTARPASAPSATCRGEYFANAAGIKLVHIPYKGTGPALADLIGGHIPMAFAPIPATHGPNVARPAAADAGGHQRRRARPWRRSADHRRAGVPGFRGGAALRRWSRRPARRARSSTSSTRRSTQRSPPTRCRSAWPSKAPSRCRARRRNTPPTSTARRSAGPRWSRHPARTAN